MSQFPSPVPPPPLNIPASEHVVKLSIIDTITRMNRLSSSMFPKPAVKVVDLVHKLGWEISVTKNVSDILAEHGVALESMSSIIWSHYHWGHTGDPSLFPPTTSLTVGPGFKAEMLSGYPTNPSSPILESAYKDRELIEVSFGQSPELRIGQFRALDYFGDGSFYLLDSPGHAVGHMCGLARTTPDTFVFLGGDICHHSGQMRPTGHLPLPNSISPNPFPKKIPGVACLGSILLNLHPKHSAIEPFYYVSTGGATSNPPEAQKSLNKLIDFDCYENILTIIAHDATLLNVVDFFPKTLNNGKTGDIWRRDCGSLWLTSERR